MFEVKTNAIYQLPNTFKNKKFTLKDLFIMRGNSEL